MAMKPNFKKAYRVATENVLLTSQVISSFPVDVKCHIQEETDIKLYSYKTAMMKRHLDMPQFGTEDAFLSEKNGRFILFYNSEKDNRRIRWSLTHELGHYYLGHTLDSSKLSEEEYGVQEIEAHFFAAQVLMPDQIIHELVTRGERVLAPSLRNWFQVSRTAAEKRLETINRKSGLCIYDFGTDYSQELIFKFASFIDGIKPKYANGSIYNDIEEEERQVERDSWLYDW